MRRLEDFSSEKQGAGDGPIEECWWDVITEKVLPRLPGQVLQTFRTVCKNWSRIISSPYFVGLHLKLYNRTRILVQTTDDYSKMIEYNYYYDETKHVLIPPAIRARPKIIPTKTQFLGSCDGLLCLLIENDWIATYNPSTGKYSRVQHSPRGCHVGCSWFGRRPSSGEYVLILGDCSCLELSAYKFSRGTRLEKIHSVLCRPYSFKGIGTFLHGALHWPAVKHDGWRSCGIIIAYHLEDNKFREISCPRVGESNFKVGANAEGCLFAIVGPMKIDDGFEMWIMKEYGVQQSWAKYASIGIDGYNVPSPLGFFPNGDLVLDVNNSKLMRYNFNDRKAVLLMNHNCFSQVIMCADTLVSPAIGQ